MFRERVCILALVILHAKHAFSVLSCVAFWLYQIFPYYLIKCTNFGKLIEYEMSFLIFSTLFKTFPF
jgi:hypothetical protein